MAALRWISLPVRLGWGSIAVSGLMGSVRAADPAWALQVPIRPPVPAVREAAWVRNPIDAFILAKLESRGLVPSAPADARSLIRRASYDLTGLPPTPDEVAAFSSASDAGAYDRRVEAWLGSPRHGERFARYWLDVVRFAETTGFETNVPRPNAWPYRDWVIKSFNDDLPYDRFVMAQLAGDVLGMDEAMGFLTGGPDDEVKSPDPVLTANQRADELHDMVHTTSTAFLGLTVGCARCHAHKFDPIPQTDYYALKAIFAGVRHGERPIRSRDFAEREAKAARLRSDLEPVDSALAALEPNAEVHRRILVLPPYDPRVMPVVPSEGVATYADGTHRGAKGDTGAAESPTIGRGYLYWHGTPDRDVLSWTPGLAGRFRLWASWGSGWHTHARDARYVLDTDGDLSTRADQREIARADHRLFADGAGDVPDQPLWSGLCDLGVHDLSATSKLVLRSGATDAYVSADVLVMQEEPAFAPVAAQPTLRSPVSRGTNVDSFPPVEARFVRFRIQATSGGEPCLDELEIFSDEPQPRNLARDDRGVRVTSSGDFAGNPAHSLAHLTDGEYGNDRSWISNEPGSGWVQVELPERTRIRRVTWGRDRSAAPRFADRLAIGYTIEVSEDAAEWRPVASSADRLPSGMPLPGGRLPAPGTPHDSLAALLKERDTLTAEIAVLTSLSMSYCGQLTEPEETRIFYRGDPTQLREPVAPAALSAVPVKFELPAPAKESDRRLALAQWIASRDNPLTARVIVNRLWQWHFGEGLVPTPSDFGGHGIAPTHPELLDWLASELMDHGWSLRHIHRLIVTSATFRQDTAARADAQAADASTSLWWRFPPRRLEAEVIRDATLAVSGTLDLTAGGPGFSTFEPNTNYVRVYTPKTSFGPQDFRRMIYMTKVRMQPEPTFGVFDCPDAGQVAPKRGRSTTPLQALNLLNSPFVMEQARFFADRLEHEAGADPAMQARRAFHLALQRDPEPDELAASVNVVRDHGLAMLCRTLFNTNEFLYLF